MTKTWEHKYAPAIYQLDPTKFPNLKGVWHHVDPWGGKRAHCNSSVKLDMEVVADAPPSDDMLCFNCRRYAQNLGITIVPRGLHPNGQEAARDHSAISGGLTTEK
jgi:hypothetical protein